LAGGGSVPDGDHVVVHLLQLLLGRLECVGRGVELVRLEGLVREADLEGLVIGLRCISISDAAAAIGTQPERLTSGTWSRSACDEAASVVTNLLKAGRAAGATKRWRSGEAMLLLMDLESILAPARGGTGGCDGEDGKDGGGESRRCCCCPTQKG
jgi:hypothetical protein